MTLDEFKALLEGQLSDFVDNWKRENANPSNDPEHWPMQMGEGEWYEQLFHYLDSVSTQAMSDEGVKTDTIA